MTSENLTESGIDRSLAVSSETESSSPWGSHQGSARLLWVSIGVVIGSLLTSLLPHAPLHASATHSNETFVVATGAIDEQSEGIFMLDLLTGDLRGMVLNPYTHTFHHYYQYNVLRDFPPTKSPKFLMITGTTDLRRGMARYPLARTAVYVAETSSGVVAAYGLPWDPTRAATATPSQAAFIPLDVKQVRNVPIRGANP